MCKLPAFNADAAGPSVHKVASKSQIRPLSLSPYHSPLIQTDTDPHSRLFNSELNICRNQLKSHCSDSSMCNNLTLTFSRCRHELSKLRQCPAKCSKPLVKQGVAVCCCSWYCCLADIQPYKAAMDQAKDQMMLYRANTDPAHANSEAFINVDEKTRKATDAANAKVKDLKTAAWDAACRAHATCESKRDDAWVKP